MTTETTTNFQNKMKSLHTKWAKFIEEQNMYILSKSSNPEIIDFLLSLEFVRPDSKSDDFEIEDGSHSHNINLSSIELVVATYIENGETIEKKEFNLGQFEYYDVGGYPLSNWLINGRWDNAHELRGESFTEFLWKINELELDDNDEAVIQEMFKKFEFRKRISILDGIYKSEKEQEKNRQLFQKYNETRILVAEEQGKSYVLFHDGFKIPFPTE